MVSLFTRGQLVFVHHEHYQHIGCFQRSVSADDAFVQMVPSFRTTLRCVPMRNLTPVIAEYKYVMLGSIDRVAVPMFRYESCAPLNFHVTKFGGIRQPKNKELIIAKVITDIETSWSYDRWFDHGVNLLPLDIYELLLRKNA